MFKKIKQNITENIKTEISIKKKLNAFELDTEKKKVNKKHSGAGLTDKEVEKIAKKQISAKKKKVQAKKKKEFKIPEFDFKY